MVERKDVEAAVEARRELGPEYEPQIVENFLAKIEHAIGQRDDFDVERAMQREIVRAHRHRLDLRLPLGSIALGIGVTAVALNGGGPSSGGAGRVIVTIIAWIAIAIVNAAYALRR